MTEVLIRVVFRPADGGKDFPVYFEGERLEDQIGEASAKLKSTEVSRQPSSRFEMLCEQIGTLNGAR